MRHAPANCSFLEIARDQQLRFVRIAGFLPSAFAVWIAPGERLVHRIERRDRVMWRLAGEVA